MTDLIPILLIVLCLNILAEEKRSVVNQIGRVLGKVQHQEIKVQSHNTSKTNNQNLKKENLENQN